MRESRPLSKSAGTNKTTEWSGSGRVVACIAVRLRRGRRDLSAWRRAGAPLAGGRKSYSYDVEPIGDLETDPAGRCEPGGNGPARSSEQSRIVRRPDLPEQRNGFSRKRC
jgi:hypothetical protein